MRASLSAFFSAMSFLSIIPINAHRDFRTDSLAYYPLVAIILGGISCISLLIPSSTLSAFCFLLFWSIIVGGIHLDGLADTADAWAASHSQHDYRKTRFLDIAHQPTSGPIAIVTLILVILGKFCALLVLVNHNWAILLFALAISRIIPLLLLYYYDYARPNGLAKSLKSETSKWRTWLISIFPCVAIGIFVPLKFTIIAICIICAILSLYHFSIQRIIDGITGDTIGATIEVSEFTLLLVFAITLVG